MERPLTEEEARRVVRVASVEEGYALNGHGARVLQHTASLIPLDQYGAPPLQATISAEEARLARSFDYLSRDDKGAFGVKRGADGAFVRTVEDSRPADARLDLIALANGGRIDPDLSPGGVDLMSMLIADLCERRAEPVECRLTGQVVSVLRSFAPEAYDELAEQHGWPAG